MISLSCIYTWISIQTQNRWFIIYESNIYLAHLINSGLLLVTSPIQHGLMMTRIQDQDRSLFGSKIRNIKKYQNSMNYSMNSDLRTFSGLDQTIANFSATVCQNLSNSQQCLSLWPVEYVLEAWTLRTYSLY